MLAKYWENISKMLSRCMMLAKCRKNFGQNIRKMKGKFRQNVVKMFVKF